MTWYGVHIVMVVEFKDGNQSSYPAWDDVYLIDAVDADEAARKAKLIGAASEGDAQGSFRWDERPATWVCKGIRKIIEIRNSVSATDDIGDGAEVTYQTLEFEDKASLDSFLKGEPARVLVVD